ncbi:MAG: ribose 5-phosphate isomerase B [Rikenellaceae bacterium]
MKNTIGIAADHAGYEMKEFLVGLLGTKGLDVVDYGCMSEESIDYPDYAHALARGIESGEVERGVALCGSGQGMSLTLNKHKAVRAALCWSEQIAKLSREHNDSNVLVMPARFVNLDEAMAMVNIWLTTPFEGGRHIPRVEKITSGL